MQHVIYEDHREIQNARKKIERANSLLASFIPELNKVAPRPVHDHADIIAALQDVDAWLKGLILAKIPTKSIGGYEMDANAIYSQLVKPDTTRAKAIAKDVILIIENDLSMIHLFNIDSGIITINTDKVETYLNRWRIFTTSQKQVEVVEAAQNLWEAWHSLKKHYERIGDVHALNYNTKFNTLFNEDGTYKDIHIKPF